MNDPDDVRNLVSAVARDWKRKLNWQVVDIDSATVDDLLLAPILFLNGHERPSLNARGKQRHVAIMSSRWVHLRGGLLRQARFRSGVTGSAERAFPGD